MENSFDKIAGGGDARISAAFAVVALIFVGLGCFGGGRSSDAKPVPPEYFGVWTGRDGSSITIRGDGKGDYKSGGTTVDGGTVEIDDAKKELSVTFFGIGPTLKIDRPPSGDEMTLDGVIYKRDGGNSTAPNDSPNAKKKTDDDDDSSPSSDDKSDASLGAIPSDDELQEMTQTSLMDFNDAVQAADFTNFYSTVSQLWQRQTSPAKLKELFRPFVDNKVDIGEVGAMRANFSPKPRIDESKGFKELVVEGNYDTSPTPTRFKLKYTPEGEDWKLTGIFIDNTR